jgi:hypothetical protein
MSVLGSAWRRRRADQVCRVGAQSCTGPCRRCSRRCPDDRGEICELSGVSPSGESDVGGKRERTDQPGRSPEAGQIAEVDRHPVLGLCLDPAVPATD